MARHPANAIQPEQPEALQAWPPAPAGLDPAESRAWVRLGEAAMATKLLTRADLLLAEDAARILARLRQLYADPALKATSLKAWFDLWVKVCQELGLTPHARKNIAAPKIPINKSAAARVLEED